MNNSLRVVVVDVVAYLIFLFLVSSVYTQDIGSSKVAIVIDSPIYNRKDAII